ncbi:MAG: hypothetical protein J6V07_00760 [Clostridia bacterium]|nr:hypothetical protein [Clostridia bacterium]
MKKYMHLLLALLCLPLLFSCQGETTPTGTEGDFKMTATVVAIGEKIEVEVISGPYDASGPYWVITGEDTHYRDRNGNKIGRDDLAVGDRVEITYGGQVMMSYPPQIVATTITKK